MTLPPLAFPEPTPGRQRILLLEDDESIRDAFKDLLEYEGYDLCATGDGHAAIELLSAGAKADIILLDMMMPMMDGHAFLNALVSTPAHATPVIVVSATQQEKPAGVVAFIRKPFEPDTLLVLLRKLLQPQHAPAL